MLKPATVGLLVRDRQACRVAAIALCALCALGLAGFRTVLSQQVPVPPPANPPPAQTLLLVPPPAAAEFQQSMQLQQVRDQLQQRQLESDLRRGVSERARQALDPGSRNRTQLDQAAQAQQARDQAAQQALVDQYWGTNRLPPPASVAPAKARSGQ